MGVASPQELRDKAPVNTNPRKESPVGTKLQVGSERSRTGAGSGPASFPAILRDRRMPRLCRTWSCHRSVRAWQGSESLMSLHQVGGPSPCPHPEEAKPKRVWRVCPNTALQGCHGGVDTELALLLPLPTCQSHAAMHTHTCAHTFSIQADEQDVPRKHIAP